MNILIQLIKLIALFLCIFIFALHSALIGLLPLDTWSIRQLRARAISLWCRWALIIVNVQVIESGQRADTKKSHLFVSNHLSYLDVLVLASLYPSSFVTSVEIKNTPFLGWLSRLGGCLYVERRNRFHLGDEIKDITTALEKGLSVTIFPEATSTNGDIVLRFRRPLYQAAIDSQSPIKPICLNYITINNQIFNLENRDTVCWYDKMPFLSHLWNLMGCKSIRVMVSFLPTVHTNKYNSPHELASYTHQVVSEEFKNGPSLIDYSYSLQ